MPKKQIDDDEDIIEIEEFTEPNQEKSVKKQNTDKKAKIKSQKKHAPPESEEEDSRAEIEEEEEEEKPIRKNKPKITSKTNSKKQPISDKRLEVLKKGREVAAANRAKKKEEQIAKLKKELWEDFNGKVQVPPKPQSTKSERLVPLEQLAPLEQPQEIISKMRERISSEFIPSGRPMKSFIKIK
jgi:hypothetical protein